MNHLTLRIASVLHMDRSSKTATRAASSTHHYCRPRGRQRRDRRTPGACVKQSRTRAASAARRSSKRPWTSSRPFRLPRLPPRRRRRDGLRRRWSPPEPHRHLRRQGAPRHRRRIPGPLRVRSEASLCVYEPAKKASPAAQQPQATREDAPSSTTKSASFLRLSTPFRYSSSVTSL